MRGHSKPIARILRVSLSESPDRERLARLVAGVDLSTLVEAARYHRVIGLVHRALRGVPGVDDDVRARLDRFHRQGLVAHLHVLATLRRVSDALDPAVGPWLVVKGPVLVELAYRQAGLRLYQDLDLVIPRASFAGSLERLETNGFELVDRNWDLIRRLMIGELVAAHEGGVELDIHWDIRYDREIRRAISISTEELTARSRTVTVNGIPTRTLDATDTLLFLAFHATKQGGDKLIWLKDLERTIANDPPSWPDLVERSRASGLELFVGAMLLRAKRTAGAAVPEEALNELLAKRAWRVMLAALDRAFPPERSDGFGTPATLVVRSMRPDVKSTLVTASSGFRNRVRRLLATGAARRDEGQDDPDDPASRAFATGEPGSRERYLEEVMQEP